MRDRTGTLAALGLVALVVLLFHDVVFSGRVLYEWDIHLLWHAQAAAFRRALAEGSLPVWNPLASFGLPMLADPNSQVFYPPTWLLLIVPPLDLHGPLVLGHLLFSAIGAFLLFRRLGLSAGAAFTGAACWIASGPLLSLVPYFNHFASATWLPWVLLANELALEKLTFAAALVWGGALTLQLFAGSPDFSLLTGLLCAGLALRRFVGASGLDRAKVARSAGVALAALVLLSAAQWMPALELARRSTRWGMGASAASYWSFHPQALLETITPAALWARPFEARIPFLHSVYLGLPALVLVAAGLLAGHAPRRLFMAWSGGLALLFAFGHHAPFHGTLVTLFPPLGLLRYPEKALVVVAFGCAYLAGAGVDAWVHSMDHRRRFLRWSGGVCAVAAIAVLVLAHHELNAGGPREIFTLRPAPLADLGDPLSARIWVYDYFDGDASQRLLHREEPLAIVRRPRGWSAQETAALAMRNYLFPPSAGSWNVRGSFDEDVAQVYPRPLEALVRLARRLEGTPAGLELLRLGAVTHVLALHDVSHWGLTPVATEPGFFPEDVRVFRVPAPLPRARLVGPQFDPGAQGVLDSDPAAAVSATGPVSGDASIVEERADRIRIETTSPGPAWLILADTWDPGWQATIDGAPAPILRAHLAFRAIRLPAGHHVVEQRYRPFSILAGAAVSALAWAVALGVGARRLRARP